MSDKESDGLPPWRYEKQTQEKIEEWKAGLHAYLKFKNCPTSHEKFNIGLVKRVIPHVASHFDFRWKDFDFDTFDQIELEADKAMYEMIKMEVARRQEEEAKAKKAKQETQEKAAAEKHQQDQHPIPQTSQS